MLPASASAPGVPSTGATVGHIVSLHRRLGWEHVPLPAPQAVVEQESLKGLLAAEPPVFSRV